MILSSRFLYPSFLEDLLNIDYEKETEMNKDIAEGNWKQLSGKIKQKWGKLTDDDLKRAEGNSEYLIGKLQERYGLAKDKAEHDLKEMGCR